MGRAATAANGCDAGARRSPLHLLRKISSSLFPSYGTSSETLTSLAPALFSEAILFSRKASVSLRGWPITMASPLFAASATARPQAASSASGAPPFARGLGGHVVEEHVAGQECDAHPGGFRARDGGVRRPRVEEEEALLLHDAQDGPHRRARPPSPSSPGGC